MKEKKKRNKRETKSLWYNSSGITLIALVITVIVLLILAGTAITLSINGGNLFSKTNEAANEWNAAVAKEETAVKNVLSVLDELSPSPVTVSTDIPAKWKTNDGTNNNISKVAIAGGRTVPIPTGFTVSDIEGENTISGGLVIYQVENTPTTGNFWTEPDDNDENLLKCQTTYNQFVWIPVDDINQMVMCKENTGSSVCNLVLQSDGSLKCMTHHATQGSTELCGRLYGVATPSAPAGTSASNPYAYEIKMNFDKTDQTWEETGYREPDLVETNDTDANVTTTSAGVTNAEGLRGKLKADFKAMAESVAKYGGFYVGRYEAGYDASSYTSVKGQTVMTAAAASANKWYGLYKYLNTAIGGATSTMIWGCQYDQVIRFIGSQAQIGHLDRYLWSSTTAGTISGYEPANNTKPLDIMKNIYDLEGNYYEWTAQAYSTNLRVLRGGVYRHVANGNFFPASRSGTMNSINEHSISSSRPALYL